jgi:hypothetical protein
MLKPIALSVLIVCLTIAPVLSGAQSPGHDAPPDGPINARALGAKLDGSAADLARLQAIYDATPAGGTIEVPGGKWPVNELGWALPLVKKTPGKRVYWKFLGPVDAGLNAAPGTNPVLAVGDGDLTQSFAHGILTFTRNLMTGKDETTPSIRIDLNNHNGSIVPASYGSGPNLAALEIDATSFPGSTGQLNGLWVNLDSGGNNPFTSEEQGLNVIVTKRGQNSTWQMSGTTYDTTGVPPKSFASIGQELDLIANGPDDPASLYNGHKGNRVFAYYSGRPNLFPAYETGKAYPVGAKVAATPAGGVKSVYIATKGGTSGARAPVWPKSGEVADNGMTWVYGEPYDVTIGRGIWFDGDKDGPDVPHVKYATLFSSNAVIENAAMDLSQTSLAYPASAAIRLAQNEPIDFSGNGTAAGQNVHILQYAEKAGALTYTVRGSVALSVADTGLASFPGQIQAPLAAPKSSSSPCVAGTRMADANFEYVCVATNSWKRAALSAF